MRKNDKETKKKEGDKKESLTEKYGSHTNNRQDWIQRMDQKIPGSDKTLRQYLDENKDIENPALFAASLFEEGVAKWAEGVKQWGEDPDYRQRIKDKKYPYVGVGAFGLDTIGDRADEFIKKGYLPADFKSRYQPMEFLNEKQELVNSGNFNDFNDVVLAKKAYFNAEKDAFNAWTKKNNIDLSENAKAFFQTVSYNAGPGVAAKIAVSWSKNGMLKNDRFLREAPPSDSYFNVWKQNMTRIQGSNMLIGESGVKGRETVWNRPQEKPIEFKNNTKMALPALLAAAPALISGVSQLFGNKRRKREEEKATAGMSRMSDIFSEQLEGDYMDTSEATGAMTQIDQNQQANLAQINANSATQGLTDEARIAMMGRSQQATSGAIGGLAKSADLWRQRLLQQKQGALGSLYQVGQQNRQNFNQSISNIVNPLQKSIDTGFSSGAFDVG